MTLTDFVTWFVIVLALIVTMICLRKARRLSGSARSMFVSASVVLMAVASIYSLIASTAITLESVIDFPLLRILVGALILVTGALAIAYDTPPNH